MTAVAQEIDLTVFAEDIDNALADRVPCIMATCDADGRPNLGPKGSVMVFDRDHFAYLERTHGLSIENLRKNPYVAILYRNSAKRISARRFYGIAEVHESGPVRDEIRARSVDPEVQKDPENRGVGVLIRIDRVVDGSDKVLQQR